MKKIVLLIPLLFFASCNGNDKVPSYHFDDSLATDLNTLLSSNKFDTITNLPFNVETTKASSKQEEGYYVASIALSYKDTEIHGFHCIAIPSSYSLENMPSNVSSVGYQTDKQFTLASTLSVESYQFIGFRLSYLTSEFHDGMKVFVRGEINQKLSQFVFQIEDEKIQITA